jgi:cyclic beta-1,2-glucan synthetase
MILNNEQLQNQAREFALTNQLRMKAHRWATGSPAARFWPVFRSDMSSLHAFAERLATSRAECMQPAEDWLLDHIAFLEAQAEEVKQKLPRSTLHKLTKQRDTGMPQIYAICDDYLKHTDGLYDVHTFETYLKAYQEVSVLKVIECWTLPAAMRVVAIRHLAEAMHEVRHRHEVCGRVASLLGHIGAKNMTDDKIRALLDKETRERPLDTTEVVHFVKHLSEWEPDIRIVREWLRAHVENSESSLEQMVTFEHELQAEQHVTCGNLVKSLHTLERQPWRLTFVRISHVEQILLSDTASEYEDLDFESQDILRGRVTQIAGQLNVPETLVADAAVKLAQYCQSEINAEGLQRKDGYLAHYLLDPHGMQDLRRALAKVTRPRRLPGLVLRGRPLSVYVSSAVILFVGLMILFGNWVTLGTAIRPLSVLAIVAMLFLPVSEWVITILHAAIGQCCRSMPLLRYDFSKELPKDAATMVVMPIIWSSVDEVDDVSDRLLVHYLANRQENIYFGILADFPDASTEIQDGDNELVAHAVSRIEALQNKYGQDRFFLFHRTRRYNPVDGLYMGWERKRGKLVEFVELLSGSGKTSFTTVIGQTDILKRIRYVFTVDHDTQLPIGTVNRMAGTIHFPYNRPRLNENETRVVHGHGVLQPRIGVSYESTEKSRFAALWASEPGIDPYAFAVSNTYQDFFGQAIFVGKGIFDVEVFQKTLVNRIPDNQVLSHDLLEGGFLRAGLTEDIEVVEEQPATFYAFESRAHRWIRGDWQLVKWLPGMCEDRNGNRKQVDLCGLTRMQILDNLRRSLLAPCLLMVALLGLRVLPGRGAAWEIIVVLTVFLPFLDALVHAVRKGHSLRGIRISFLQSTVRLMTLPFSAVLATDAILRTLYRMFVSHRKLLEWVPAAKTNRRKMTNNRVFVFERIGYALIGIFAIVTAGTGSIQVRTIGFALTVFWLLSRPVISVLNRSAKHDEKTWLATFRPELLQLAKQIWSFYDQYVTEEESWLPPDNVQYHPSETIAHRTSPTNIGLYLASIVAACDLSLIDCAEMIERLEKTVGTIAKMEKWNGHLLNWYDTCRAKPLSPRYVSTVDSGNLIAYLMVVRQGLTEWMKREHGLASRIRQLVNDIDLLIEQTDFFSLYNSEDRLFCLGYQVDAGRKDTVLYDLLASEARQASFVAIALGQIPVSHWFTLARTMTLSGGHKTLLSWSGTMFEYLMPALIMRTYRNTVWDSTYRGVVFRQRQYAGNHRVPFGISESGYYAYDYDLNYQYRAFGVPGIGFGRGLERNLVAAPYATIMALPFAGEPSMAALKKFEELGARGKYGFYEAVDFTRDRLPHGHRHEVIQSFMAHHQGMSMLAISNLLTDEKMVERFHANPHVRAADLLLQERIPKKAALIEEPIGIHAKYPDLDGRADDTERKYTERTALPEVNVLSNGKMTSVTSNDGTGLLRWNDLAVTRWREDPVASSSGVIVYIHDVDSEKTWSATGFGTAGAKKVTSVFRLDKTTYEMEYDGISSKLELTVSPDVDAEVRRVRLVNHGEKARTLEITSFLELALATQSSDSAHPAFSKLFIQTSHDAKAETLFAKRRPRAADETETWAVHTVYVDGREVGDYEFETDRGAFLGRGYSLQMPKGIRAHLRGSVGSVADPAFVMRRSVHLAKGESANIYIVTGVAQSKEQGAEIVERLREPAQADRAFHLAWVRSQIDLRHLHLTAEQAVSANLLAGRLLYTPPLSPLRREAISENRLGQSALWPHGVSGDAPIVTLRVRSIADLPFVTLLARQHQYLCMLGLQVDLVVLDETVGGYKDELIHRLRESLMARGIAEMKRIIGVKYEQLSEDEQILLFAVSQVLLRAGGPSLGAQLQIGDMHQSIIPSRVQQNVPKVSGASSASDVLSEANALGKTERAAVRMAEGEFFNGWGGFVEEGKAYRIHVGRSHYLPRPWTNILANPHFGTILTELGTGYSWWKNSHECKLTPWNNDPILDPPGECLYVRDMDSGEFWSAAPKPAGNHRTYEVTHGHGYSIIEQTEGDISHTMEVTVPLHDPLKLVKFTLRNRSDQARRVSVTYYAEWVLGVEREAQAPFIVTEWDKESSALLARNTYQDSFRDALGFLSVANVTFSNRDRATALATEEATAAALAICSWTADRSEFIGRDGSLTNPAALHEDRLSFRTGTLSNTCGAVQTEVVLPANSESTVMFLLGCTDSKENVQALVRKYSHVSAYEDVRSEVSRYWDGITGQVKVKTPDRALDILLNGWLLYQTLACRLWARTAFYQAGGAFGFRDQLQDSLALLHSDASITREQILKNAAHQYQKGDVQHWWHDETHKGMRTRISDDLLWLPYAVSRYVEHTGDFTLLNEMVPFLHSEVLKDEEKERYEDTIVSNERGTILDHCLRAIQHAMKFGEHGIPLMGIGDWNDGMNLVGAKGRGESVWLGWFLLDILKRYIHMSTDFSAAVAEVGKAAATELGEAGMGLSEAAERLSQGAEELNIAAEKLERNLNEYAWDGAWFRRAYTDAGMWLGSIEDRECRIDAIAQSWAVMSQGTSVDRQIRAMRSFDRELVDRDLSLAQLLTKAFDKTEPSPGYIQGYPPGIRENGGQYTHGVIWGIVAWAMLEERDKAFELFSMLNPISHTQTGREVQVFGNEPYVMTADVYTADPHQGQAGWSWYTGAAGWMYQAGLEYVLGVTRRANRLYIRPCVPFEWDSFAIDYRYGNTTYKIEVECTEKISVPAMWSVDGQEAVQLPYLQLLDDGKVHTVTVYASSEPAIDVG